MSYKLMKLKPEARKALERFVDATVAWAFRGTVDTEQYDFVIKEYRESKKALLEFLPRIET